MNTTSSIDGDIYHAAEASQLPATPNEADTLSLPAHIENLEGCLAGVEAKGDERFDYLMEKNR